MISLGEAAVEEANNTDPAVNAFLKSNYGAAKTMYGGRDVIFRDDEVRTLLDTLVKTRHVQYAGSISEELDKESIVSREVYLYPDKAMSESDKTVFSVNRGMAADGYERYFISLILSGSAYECYITQEEYIDFVNAVSEKAVGYPAHYLYRSSPDISGIEHSIYLDGEDSSRCTAYEIDDDIVAAAVPWGDKNILYIYSISQQKIIYQAAFSRYEFSGSCMILTDITHHTDSPDPDKFGMYSDDTIGRKFFLLTRNDNMYAGVFDPVSCSMLFSVYGEDTYYTVDPDSLIDEDETGVGTGSITKDGKRIYLDITDDIPALCNLEIVIEDSGSEKRYRLFGTERFDMLSGIRQDMAGGKLNISMASLRSDDKTANITDNAHEIVTKLLSETALSREHIRITEPVAPRIDDTEHEKNTLTLFDENGEDVVISLEKGRITDGGNIGYMTVTYKGYTAEYLPKSEDPSVSGYDEILLEFKKLFS